MAPDDYYVEMLDAGDSWYDLIEQEHEPTDDEWTSAHERLADAVKALREYEATAGASLRDEPWGGQRTNTVAVIEAADHWYSLSVQDDEPPQAEQDAALDRLGNAILALRDNHESTGSN